MISFIIQIDGAMAELVERQPLYLILRVYFDYVIEVDVILTTIGLLKLRNSLIENEMRKNCNKYYVCSVHKEVTRRHLYI